MDSHILVKATRDGVQHAITGDKYPKGVETIAVEDYYIRKLFKQGELEKVTPKKAKAEVAEKPAPQAEEVETKSKPKRSDK